MSNQRAFKYIKNSFFNMWFLFLCIAVTPFYLFQNSLITNAQSTLIPTEANLKIAFVGDSGIGSNNTNVLKLIKSENTDLLMHLGDFDYTDSPTKWTEAIDSYVGRSIPYLAVVGNHDTARWSGYQAYIKERVANTPNLTCTGDIGVKATCKFKGLFFVLSGVGLMGSGHDTYIRDELAKNNSLWSVCSWHVNQNAMQAGTKGDQAGWGPYEECRKAGGVVATAHEHSYSRTKTLSNFTNQTVDSTCSDPKSLCVDPNRTFAFVSGLGGSSVRAQSRCLPATYPYGCKGEWAKMYTSNQSAKPGALFIEFNVDGNPSKAKGYFKNISGEIIDEFTIMTNGKGTSTSPSPKPTTTPTSGLCFKKSNGDTNCDNDIDLMDFEIFRSEYLALKAGTLNIMNATADFNNDKTLDLLDFNIFRNGYITQRIF